MAEIRNFEFTELIDSFKGMIYKIADTYARNPEERADLEQEIIEQIWRSYDRYDKNFRISTWLYRIALNVAISFYRRESLRKRKRADISEGMIIYIENPDEEAAKDENLKLLKQFIGELNEINKALILLYLEDRSYREIAEIMGTSESNVGTRMNRIKTSLKEKFNKV